MATSPTGPLAPSTRTPDMWNLFKGSPATAFQYVDVVFPSTPDTDLVVQHILTPIDPETVRFVVVSQDRAGSVYQDQSATRRPWGAGYVVLRCSAGNMAARLLLVQQRGTTTSLPLNGGDVVASRHVGISGFSGLHLRTHPDADKAANQIALLGLDQVVMNDGMRYSGLSSILPLSADITVPGAGGLDTGSRVASTWYEAYLIGKSSTGAIADLRLILHRAKDYKLDQSQTTDNNGELLRAGATDRVKLAQGFQVATAGPVEKIDAKLVRNGTVSGRIWLTIETDNAGSPSGAALATSDKLDASLIATSAAQWIDFPFRAPATLAIGTQYHLVLQGDYAPSGTNEITWRGEASGTYADGSMKKFDGTSWAAAGPADAVFMIYVTENDVDISTTLPTGYDQYCQLNLGIYNTGGSVLRQFEQHGRLMKHDFVSIVAGLNASVDTLIDLGAIVPPGPVDLLMAGASTVAGDFWYLGGIPNGYSQANPVARLFFSPTTSPHAPVGEPLVTEFQGMYAMRNSGTGNLTLFAKGYQWR